MKGKMSTGMSLLLSGAIISGVIGFLALGSMLFPRNPLYLAFLGEGSDSSESVPINQIGENPMDDLDRQDLYHYIDEESIEGDVIQTMDLKPVKELGFKNVFMAMPTVIDKDGVHYTAPEGTPQEMADLQASYEHLCEMRDEIVSLGIVPPVEDWKKENPNL